MTSSTSSKVAVLGACCRMNSRLAKPSTTTSELGASTVLGNNYTLPCATALRNRLRVRLKRDPQPSASIVDSQSVKTTGVGGAQRGYNGGKKVKGRKRHLLVDTEGLALKANGHSAKVLDQEGIKPLVDGAKELFPRLSHLWLDALATEAKGHWAP